MARRLVFGACAVLGAVASSGCSLILVDKPPIGDGPIPSGLCTSSPVIPILDLGAATFSTTLAVMALAENSPDSEDEELFAILAGATGATMGYTAAKGFSWSNECRRRQAMSEAALTSHLRAVSTAPDPFK